MSGRGQYLGKFRGTVVNNLDPEQRGRIQVMVPDVSGVALTSWAMPSLPVGGPQMGMFTVPAIGAGVWVEFEQGDLDYPIWVGCYWGSTAEVPALAHLITPGLAGLVIQTTLQNALLISDVPGPTGGIMLKCATGAMILINDVGITISNGKGATIVLAGPSVTVNQGALVVT